MNESSVRDPGYLTRESNPEHGFFSHIVSLKTAKGIIHRSFCGKMKLFVGSAKLNI